MKWNCLLLLIVSSLLVMAACKKQAAEQGPPTIAIQLDPGYLLPSQVDSAFATWELDGRQKKQRLLTEGNMLLADISQWPQGKGSLEVDIYSNKKYSGQYRAQWFLRKAIDLEPGQSLSMAGPASFFDNAWKPRVALNDQNGHAAVIALRPDDPYFLIGNPPHPYLRITLERAYWKTTGGVFFAGGLSWHCTTNCVDVANEESFLSLPQRIGSHPWNLCYRWRRICEGGGGGRLLFLYI